MQTTKKFSLAQRMLMLMTAFLMAFCNLPVQMFVNADDTENRALTVVLNADRETVHRGAEIDTSLGEEGYFVNTGDTISFQLQSALNNAEGQEAVTVHVNVTSECELDFSNSFRDGVLVMGEGENSVTLHLDEKPQNEGKSIYDVWYEIKPGQTVSGYIQFKTKPGVTESGSQIDIDVTTDKDVEGGSDLKITQGKDGHMDITAEGKVDWNEIKKTANPENLKIAKKEDGSFSLDSDVTYHITAYPPEKLSGVIYADNMVVTDTLTLPQGLDFPDDIAAELVGDAILIKSGDIIVMKITDNSDLGFSSATMQNISATVDGKNLTLSFQRFSENKQQQLAPLNWTAVLQKDGLIVNEKELEDVPEDTEITNTASFTVAPVTDPGTYIEPKVSDPADVPVDCPKPELTISKEADQNSVEPGDTITYTITAENKGDIAWHGSIEDTLGVSENIQIISASAPPVGKIDGNSVTWDDVTVLAGGRVAFIVEVKVEDGFKASSLRNDVVATPTHGDNTPKANKIVTVEQPTEPTTEPELKVDKKAVKIQWPSGGGSATITDLESTSSSNPWMISGKQVMYYIVKLHNNTNEKQTYKIEDRKDRNYFDTNWFVASSVPTDAITSGGCNFSVNNRSNDSTFWGSSFGGMAYYDPDSLSTNDSYYVLGSDTKDIEGKITVNGKSTVWVFMPFTVDSNDSSFNPNSTTTITPNNVYISPLDKSGEPTKPPVETKSGQVVVKKGHAVKTHVSPNGIVITDTNRNENSATYAPGQYVYYKIDIPEGASDYSFVDFLPPYLEIDDSSPYNIITDYMDNSASTLLRNIYSNEESFKNTYLLSRGILVPYRGTSRFSSEMFTDTSAILMSDKNSGPPPENAKVLKLKYDAKASISGGQLANNSYANRSYTSESTVYGTALYFYIPGMSPDKYSVYIRCKVNTTATYVNDNKDIYFDLNNYPDSAHSQERAQVDVNVIADSPSAPYPADNSAVPLDIKAEKYAINPNTADKLKEAFKKNGSGGLTWSFIQYCVDNEWLLEEMAVSPDEKVDYLIVVGNPITFTPTSSPENAIVSAKYQLMDTLPEICEWNTGNVSVKNDYFEGVTGSDFPFQYDFNGGKPLWKNNTDDTITFNYKGIEGDARRFASGTVGYAVYFTVLSVTMPDTDTLSKYYETHDSFQNTLSLNNRRGSLVEVPETVTHNTPLVKKTVSESTVFANNSKTAKFKLYSAGSYIGAKNVTWTDDLTGLQEYFDITEVNLGKFDIQTGDGKSDWYVVATVNGKEKEIASSETLSSEELAGLTKLEWKFYAKDATDSTLAKFTVTAEPTVTVQLKKGIDLEKLKAQEVSGTNTLTVDFDGKPDTDKFTSKATVDGAYLELEKTATYSRKGEALAEDKPLLVGDTANFTITITNPSKTSFNLNGYKLTDIPGDVFEMTSEEIEGLKVECNSTACKCEPKMAEDGFALEFTKGTISGESSLTISYSLPIKKVGKVKNTVSDHFTNAEYTGPEVIDAKVADIYLQKAVAKIGTDDKSVHQYNILKGEKETITYEAVVYNKSDSLPIAVEYLYDELPEDFSYIEGTVNPTAETTGWEPDDKTAKWAETDFKISGEAKDGGIAFTIKSTDTDHPVLMLQPGEYLTFSYDCEIDLTKRRAAYAEVLSGNELPSDNEIYLACEETNHDIVYSWKTKTNDKTFAHTAQGTDDENANYGKCSTVTNEIKESQLDELYAASNATKLDAKKVCWEVSHVQITPNGYIQPEISKELQLYKAGSIAPPEDFPEDQRGQAKILTMNGKSALKWEIQIENSGETPIQNYTFHDIMPNGYKFIAFYDDADTEFVKQYLHQKEQDVNSTVKKYPVKTDDGQETKTVNYDQLVWALCDEDGNIVDLKTFDKTSHIDELTAASDGTEVTILFHGDDYSIPVGYTAKIFYWGYYPGKGLGNGEFTNTADLTFSQTVSKESTAPDSGYVRGNIFRVGQTLSVSGGSHTSSVKQITDTNYETRKDGKLEEEWLELEKSMYGESDSIYEINGQKFNDYAARFNPTEDALDSKNNGTNANGESNNDKPNGYGDRIPTKNKAYTEYVDNYVIAEKAGDLVDYTLHISNDNADLTIDRMTVIDKLPHPGDTGTMNTAVQRNSEFTVNLQDKPAFDISITDGINGESIRSFIQNTDYIVLYTQNEAYTQAEHDGTDVIDDFDTIANAITAGEEYTKGNWHTTYNQTTDKAFRIVCSKNYQQAPNTVLRIAFRGVIAGDASAGKFAWNSFEYTHKLKDNRLYELTAEPEKVGVKIGGSIERSNLLLHKTDNADNDIENAEFLIYYAKVEGDEWTKDSEAAVQKVYSDEDGYVEFTGLLAGQYLITESAVGYKENPTEYKMDLRDIEPGKTYTIADPQINDGKVIPVTTRTRAKIIKNTPITITISKQDITNNEELPGAKLTVRSTDGMNLNNVTAAREDKAVELAYSEDGTSFTFTSGEQVTEFSKLPAGEYMLTEETAPDGYTVAETITFRVHEDGTIDVQDENGEWKSADNVTMRDEVIQAAISKKGITGDAEVPGAELTITRKDGKSLSEVTGTQGGTNVDMTHHEDGSITFTSGDDETVLKKLPAGEYMLTEEKAPEGYTSYKETITFRVHEDGTIDVQDENGEWKSAENVTMRDEVIQAAISKQDITNGKELPGAKLTVKSVDGTNLNNVTAERENKAVELHYSKDGASFTFTSGEQATTFSKLPAGIYSLTEETAPEGYNVAETITFRVHEDGTIEVLKEARTDENGKTDWEKSTWEALTSNKVIMEDERKPIETTATVTETSAITSSTKVSTTTKQSTATTKSSTTTTITTEVTTATTETESTKPTTGVKTSTTTSRTESTTSTESNKTTTGVKTSTTTARTELTTSTESNKTTAGVKTSTTTARMESATSTESNKTTAGVKTSTTTSKTQTSMTTTGTETSSLITTHKTSSTSITTASAKTSGTESMTTSTTAFTITSTLTLPTVVTTTSTTQTTTISTPLPGTTSERTTQSETSITTSIPDLPNVTDSHTTTSFKTNDVANGSKTATTTTTTTTTTTGTTADLSTGSETKVSSQTTVSDQTETNATTDTSVAETTSEAVSTGLASGRGTSTKPASATETGITTTAGNGTVTTSKTTTIISSGSPQTGDRFAACVTIMLGCAALLICLCAKRREDN